MGEIAVHGMNEEGSENVVIFDFAHGHNATMKSTGFRKRVPEWGVISQAEFKGFHKEGDLGICALMFVEFVKAGKDFVGSGASGGVVNV